MKKLFTTIILTLSIGYINQTKAQLVFTEIMYNPPEAGTDSLEYIELYNSGSSAVDLNGYTLAFGGLIARYTFTASYNLPPAGFAVFANNSMAVKRNYSLTFTPLQGPAMAGLSNAGTNIKLFNGPVSSSSVTIVDSVSYSNSWVTGSNGLGKSMVFCPGSGDNSISTNWKASSAVTTKTINTYPLFGSPGFLEPTVSITSQPTSFTTCAGSNASFSVSASGASLTYQWKKGSTNVGINSSSLTFTNISLSDAGVYNVLISDDCGTITSNSATLTVNAKPTITVNSGTICAGQSFTIVPIGASTYSYSGGSSVVIPSTTESYTITGSIGSCTNTAISTVTVNALPTVSVTSGAICTGQSFTMVPSGASTYSYSSGSSTITPSATTSYSITGTSIDGCVSSNTAVSTVTVNALPTVSITSGAICAGQSFTMVPSGAITYNYSSGSSTVTPSTTTSYSVTGTSIDGCVSSNIAVSTVTVNTLPTVSITSGAICAGQSFIIVPSGANTYTYSSGSSTVTPITTTSYSVTGTSIDGCVSSNTAVSTVTVNTLPTVTAITSNSFICTGSTANLTASGATTYTWSTTSTNTVIAVSPTTTTVYTVTGVDANGCSNFATVTQSVSLCTSINSSANIKNLAFIVYPNPSTGVFNFELESNTRIIVLNALGSEILNEVMPSGENTVNLNAYKNGIYFMKAINANNQTTVKVIKE